MRSTYPFGRALRPVQPAGSGPSRLFVLGAYPSALHVRWTPPPGLGLRAVQALAVADEPEPFWTGEDETDQLAAWRALAVAGQPWGAFEAAGRFNGSTGRHLRASYLAPFGARLEDAWRTDIVNTYFVSRGGASAIAASYRPAAAALGLPDVHLPERPAPHDLVALAARDHRDRIVAELEEAQPEHVLTIGEEPLAALWEVGVEPLGGGPRLAKLSAAAYGRRLAIVLPNGHRCLLHPLAHPNLLYNPKPDASPGLRAGIDAYRSAHTRWTEVVARDFRRG